MSIILDALKKAEKDRSDGTESADNSLPPPVPSSSPFQGPNKKKPSPLMIALLVVCLAGAGGLAYLRITKKPKDDPLAVDFPKPIVKITEKKETEEDKQKKINLLYDEAMGLAHAGKLSDSAAKWQDVLKANPENAEAYNNYGVVLKKMNEKKKAEQAYRKSLELKPEYPEALNNLGAILIDGSAKDQNEALMFLQKAIELNPQYADPHFHLGLLFEKKEQGVHALEHYQNFLDLAPNMNSDIRARLEMKVTQLKLQAPSEAE